MDDDYLPNPEIRFYNRLKNFFRCFETESSRRRMTYIRGAVDYCFERGHLIGFDVLGSGNFGMSYKNSDVDVVLYYEDYSLDAEFEKKKVKLLTSWIEEHFSRQFRDVYNIQFVDYINLCRVEMAIRISDPYSVELQSFLLYRAIGRGVHYRILERLEKKLLEDPELMMYLEDYMRDTFRELITNPTSRFSFSKYAERLKDQGQQIPPDIEEMLNYYLQGKIGKLMR